MIQRIQTLYMLLACIASVFCMASCIGYFVAADGETTGKMFCLMLDTFRDGQTEHHFTPWALFVILLVSSTLSLLDIFLFTRRALQMRLASFCMILSALWYAAYGAFVYVLGSDLDATFRFGWPAILPAVALILQYLRDDMVEVLLILNDQYSQKHTLLPLSYSHYNSKM